MTRILDVTTWSSSRQNDIPAFAVVSTVIALENATGTPAARDPEPAQPGSVREAVNQKETMEARVIRNQIPDRRHAQRTVAMG